MTAPDAPAPRRPAFPWCTLSLAAAAGWFAVSPAAAAWAVYDRAAILHGQLWRLATGHFVHLGPTHLAWNLVVWLVAGTGLERRRPSTARLFLCAAPWALGLWLLALAPSLAVYAGLSGLATGVVILFALHLCQGGSALDRATGAALLLLVTAKIFAEAITGHAWFVHALAGAHVRLEPLAHTGGAACAIVLWAASRPHGTR